MTPFDWTEEITESLCDRIAGGEGISELAGTDGFPSEPTIYRKMAADDVFAAKIAKARAAQQHYEMDQCVVIADEARVDDWQVAKLRIWARQWRASKLAPRVYGDKIAHVGGNPDTDQPIQLGVTVEPGEAYRRLIKGEG